MFGPRSNSILKRFALLVIVVCATIITATGVARADGYLTNQEKFVGDEISGVFCDYIDSAGVTDISMPEAMRIIYTNTPPSMDMSDAVDIINYVVSSYRPQHWPALVAFGEGVRSSHV